MSNSTHPWPTMPLGELAAGMCLGKMLDKQKNRGTLQPYLRNVNVRWFSFDLSDLKEMRFEGGEETRFELQAGDLVICEGGEPGRAAVWRQQTENAKIQKALHRIRFHPDEYDPFFAMYYLFFGTITNRFVRHYTGTTIKHLTGAALSQVHFPVPPLNEQRRIVAKIEELFSDLDAGVAALERAKANLKRYRASVLKAAVEGRLTEQWRADHPPRETASQLLDRILKERRRKWEEDQLAAYAKVGKKPPANWRGKYKEPAGPDEGDLPALPERWCWATVKQLLVEDSCNGISVKGSNTPPGIPALRLNAMGESGFDYAERRYIPILADVAQALAIREGDFFVARGNGSLHLVGRGTLAQPPTEDIVFPDTMIRLRFSAPVTIRKYLGAIWPSRLLRRQIETRARTTAGIYKIAQRDVDRFVVPLPPLSEQEEVLAELERRFSIIQGAEAQLAANLKRSSRLRQSILKRAFEGKLVPQDPSDEPASVLLHRLTSQTAHTDSRQEVAAGNSRARRKRNRVGTAISRRTKGSPAK